MKYVGNYKVKYKGSRITADVWQDEKGIEYIRINGRYACLMTNY